MLVDTPPTIESVTIGGQTRSFNGNTTIDMTATTDRFYGQPDIVLNFSDGHSEGIAAQWVASSVWDDNHALNFTFRNQAYTVNFKWMSVSAGDLNTVSETSQTTWTFKDWAEGFVVANFNGKSDGYSSAGYDNENGDICIRANNNYFMSLKQQTSPNYDLAFYGAGSVGNYRTAEFKVPGSGTLTFGAQFAESGMPIQIYSNGTLYATVNTSTEWQTYSVEYKGDATTLSVMLGDGNGGYITSMTWTPVDRGATPTVDTDGSKLVAIDRPAVGEKYVWSWNDANIGPAGEYRGTSGSSFVYYYVDDNHLQYVANYDNGKQRGVVVSSDGIKMKNNSSTGVKFKAPKGNGRVIFKFKSATETSTLNLSINGTAIFSAKKLSALSNNLTLDYIFGVGDTESGEVFLNATGGSGSEYVIESITYIPMPSDLEAWTVENSSVIWKGDNCDLPSYGMTNQASFGSKTYTYSANDAGNGGNSYIRINASENVPVTTSTEGFKFDKTSSGGDGVVMFRATVEGEIEITLDNSKLSNLYNVNELSTGDVDVTYWNKWKTLTNTELLNAKPGDQLVITAAPRTGCTTNDGNAITSPIVYIKGADGNELNFTEADGSGLSGNWNSNCVIDVPYTSTNAAKQYTVTLTENMIAAIKAQGGIQLTGAAVKIGDVKLINSAAGVLPQLSVHIGSSSLVALAPITQPTSSDGKTTLTYRVYGEDDTRNVYIGASEGVEIESIKWTPKTLNLGVADLVAVTETTTWTKNDRFGYFGYVAGTTTPVNSAWLNNGGGQIPERSMLVVGSADRQTRFEYTSNLSLTKPTTSTAGYAAIKVKGPGVIKVVAAANGPSGRELDIVTNINDRDNTSIMREEGHTDGMTPAVNEHYAFYRKSQHSSFHIFYAKYNGPADTEQVLYICTSGTSITEVKWVPDAELIPLCPENCLAITSITDANNVSIDACSGLNATTGEKENRVINSSLANVATYEQSRVASFMPRYTHYEDENMLNTLVFNVRLAEQGEAGGTTADLKTITFNATVVAPNITTYPKNKEVVWTSSTDGNGAGYDHIYQNNHGRNSAAWHMHDVHANSITTWLDSHSPATDFCSKDDDGNYKGGIIYIVAGTYEGNRTDWRRIEYAGAPEGVKLYDTEGTKEIKEITISVGETYTLNARPYLTQDDFEIDARSGVKRSILVDDPETTWAYKSGNAYSQVTVGGGDENALTRDFWLAQQEPITIEGLAEGTTVYTVSTYNGKTTEFIVNVLAKNKISLELVHPTDLNNVPVTDHLQYNATIGSEVTKEQLENLVIKVTMPNGTNVFVTPTAATDSDGNLKKNSDGTVTLTYDIVGAIKEATGNGVDKMEYDTVHDVEFITPDDANGTTYTLKPGDNGYDPNETKTITTSANQLDKYNPENAGTPEGASGYDTEFHTVPDPKNIHLETFIYNVLQRTPEQLQQDCTGAPKVEVTKATLSSDMFKEYDSTGANANVTNETGCANYIGVSPANTVYGDVSVSGKNYADLSDYDVLKFTFVDGGTPRLLFNRESLDNTGTFIEINPEKNSDGTYKSPYIKDAITNSDGTITWLIDLAKIKADGGYVHLNAIKAPYQAEVKVTEATLIKKTQVEGNETPQLLSENTYINTTTSEQTSVGNHRSIIEMSGETGSGFEAAGTADGQANNDYLKTTGENSTFDIKPFNPASTGINESIESIEINFNENTAPGTKAIIYIGKLDESGNVVYGEGTTIEADGETNSVMWRPTLTEDANGNTEYIHYVKVVYPESGTCIDQFKINYYSANRPETPGVLTFASWTEDNFLTNIQSGMNLTSGSNTINIQAHHTQRNGRYYNLRCDYERVGEGYDKGAPVVANGTKKIADDGIKNVLVVRDDKTMPCRMYFSDDKGNATISSIEFVIEDDARNNIDEPSIFCTSDPRYNETVGSVNMVGFPLTLTDLDPEDYNIGTAFTNSSNELYTLKKLVYRPEAAVNFASMALDANTAGFIYVRAIIVRTNDNATANTYTLTKTDKSSKNALDVYQTSIATDGIQLTKGDFTETADDMGFYEDRATKYLMKRTSLRNNLSVELPLAPSVEGQTITLNDNTDQDFHFLHNKNYTVRVLNDYRMVIRQLSFRTKDNKQPVIEATYSDDTKVTNNNLSSDNPFLDTDYIITIKSVDSDEMANGTPVLPANHKVIVYTLNGEAPQVTFDANGAIASISGTMAVDNVEIQHEDLNFDEKAKTGAIAVKALLLPMKGEVTELDLDKEKLNAIGTYGEPSDIARAYYSFSVADTYYTTANRTFSFDAYGNVDESSVKVSTDLDGKDYAAEYLQNYVKAYDMTGDGNADKFYGGYTPLKPASKIVEPDGDMSEEEKVRNNVGIFSYGGYELWNKKNDANVFEHTAVSNDNWRVNFNDVTPYRGLNGVLAGDAYVISDLVPMNEYSKWEGEGLIGGTGDDKLQPGDITYKDEPADAEQTERTLAAVWEGEFSNDKFNEIQAPYNYRKLWSLPCYGDYFQYEPQADGVLTVSVKQQGILDQERTSLDDMLAWYRPVFVYDEQGNTPAGIVASTTSKASGDAMTTNHSINGSNKPVIANRYLTVAQSNALLDMTKKWIEANTADEDGNLEFGDRAYNEQGVIQLYGAIDNTVKKSIDNTDFNYSCIEGDNRPAFLGARGNGNANGFMVASEGYVRYTIPVKAGKTYFMFAQNGNLGMCSYTFEKTAEAEGEVEMPITSSVAEVKTWINNLKDKPSNIYLKRKFEAEQWSAIVLPFSVGKQQLRRIFGDGVRVVHFRSITEKSINFRRHVHQQIVAGVPVFIRPSKQVLGAHFNNVTVEADEPVKVYIEEGDNETYECIGTFGQSTVETGDFYVNGSGLFAERKGGSTAVNGSRCWLRPKDDTNKVSPVSFGFSSYSAGEEIGENDNNQATGIDIPEVDEMLESTGSYEFNNVYDASGRLVRKNTTNTKDLPAGVYIVNGEKKVVK